MATTGTTPCVAIRLKMRSSDIFATLGFYHANHRNGKEPVPLICCRGRGNESLSWKTLSLERFVRSETRCLISYNLVNTRWPDASLKFGVFSAGQSPNPTAILLCVNGAADC
jgi:hypothetical protein